MTTVSIPDHQILEALREGADRLVFRCRFRGEAAVTRVILRPVPLQLGGLIRGVVRSGKGSLAGLDDEVIATLEGYRVRCRLGEMPGLPAVLDAGLAGAPERCPSGFGLPFVTTRWIPGRTLGTAAATRAEREAALKGVLNILHGLHQANVVYGDLKPANIVRDGRSVHLIDLDTLREVADGQHPIRVTHRTPRYMAPEQEGSPPLSYLASDIFTFGLMIYELLGGWRRGAGGAPPRMPEPWGPVADACLRHQPLDRPPADAIQEYLAGVLTHLPAYNGLPLRMATEPVRDYTQPVPEPAPPPLPPASKPPLPAAPVLDVVTRTISRDGAPEPASLTEAVVAEVAAPPAPSPEPVFEPEEAVVEAPRAEWGQRGTWVLWSVVVLVLLGAGLGLAGATYVSVQYRERQAAQERYSALWKGLKEHKTVAEKNTSAVLAKLITDTEAALDEGETADLKGLYALERVWHQKWHWGGASWNARNFADGEKVVQAALDAGETAPALLARGVLLGGACWTMSDRQAEQRMVRCEESIASLQSAASASKGAGMGWFQVEIAWAHVMSASAAASHVAAEDPARARAFWEQALAQCRTGAEKLDKAPVNGVELIESCLEVAGALHEYRQYAEWAGWLQDERGRSTRLAQRLIRSVDPACAALDVSGERAPVIGLDTGGIEDVCRYVGAVSLGCADIADRYRSCRQRIVRFGKPLCIDYLRQDGVPWDEALALGDNPVRTDCYWGD